MKAPAMESGRLSSNSNLGTAAILENLGGCCEGTVFTFTSAGSRWRLRQRLNRNKASLVSPHGGLLLREDPADSVFTEMRIMPRSSEPNPSKGVELWNRNKLLNSVKSEEISRANSVADYDAGDLRDYCSVKKLTGQVGGDLRAKAYPQEAVKADHERRELQVSTEETTPRKSRRYLRCDNSRERHRYGDGVEDSKIWAWNEKKLAEVRAQELSNEASYKGNKPAEERRNKRESSAEEIHVFEQRKVKCRRREQDSCNNHSESVQSEDLFKADDVSRASYGFNHSQVDSEEPRKQQVGPVAVICPYVAGESTKNRRVSSIESAEEIEDKRFAKQKPVFELHIQRGNVTEENRSWMTPRPSTPPIACSFISFKGGVSCVGNRRCHFAGTSRSRRIPDVEHRACVGSETSQILSDNTLDQESNTRGLSISPNQTQRILELSFPRRSTQMEGSDAQTKAGRAGKPEALDDLKSMGREKEMAMPSETGAGNSSHTVCQVVPFLQGPISKELSSSWSSRTTEGSFDRGGGDALSSWERSHSGISKSKHTSVSEGEWGTRRIYVTQPRPARLKEGPRGRRSSTLLDSPDSTQVEDDLETTDLDGNDGRSHERNSGDEFSPKGEAHGPSPSQGRGDPCGDICEGSLDGMNSLPLVEVNYFEPSDVPSKDVDDGNSDLKEKLRCEINSNLRKSTALELNNQSFRDSYTDIADGTLSTEMSCTSRSEIVDLDLKPQKSVLLRRQAWVKGFKKKTGEKVSYLESWLGRSKKLHKTSPGRKCGPKGVGELSQTNRIVDKHDKFRPFGHSIDQHLISQDWSKKESQAYVTKEFEILEAVLQSEVDADDGKAKAADHLQYASVKSSAGLCMVDKEDGKWQEAGTTTEQSNTQEHDVVGMSTVATNLETEDNLVQVKCTAGDGLPFECREHAEAENSQHLHWANMTRTCKDFAKLNSLGEQESLHLVSVSNNTGDLAKEYRQKEEGEDPLAAHDKITDGIKPSPHLTVLNDSEDISANKGLNSSDFAVGELNMGDRFGGLATEISGPADHASKSRTETKKSFPSDVTPVKSSSVKVLPNARNAVDGDSNFALKSVPGADSDSALNTVDLEGSSANLTSEVDFDHFPSSIKAPNGNQNSGSERKKESPVNRRHKMPIIIRVKNRLANGWLLQHPLWKRVAKHKMITGESHTLATKGINQKEVHADPSSFISKPGSIGHSLTDLIESRTEDAINLNPPSKHEKELTGTSMPQNLILEAHHQTWSTTENEKCYQGALGEPETCKYHLSDEDMENNPFAAEKYEVVRQNQVSKKQAPHDGLERDHTKDECPGQSSSVLSFAEWQSRAKGFGKSSPSRKRVEAKSDSAVKEWETELGKSNELNDVGELLAIVCVGNNVKEATVLGAFTEFDARREVPTVLGQGKVERDAGGFKQVSVDVCGAEIPAVCRGTRETVSEVSQIASECSADGHIFNSNSDTTTSSYCQTEVPERTEAHVPVDSPASFSLKNCFPSVEEGAESELSQESLSLQKCFSLNDHNEELQSCSSSIDHAVEGAPCIPGRMQIPRHKGDSIGAQPQVDGQSDGNLSIECTFGQSAPPAPFQRQRSQGTADKEHHKSFSNLVEPFGQARVVAPFCPPLQSANACRKEIVQGDGTVKERGMEDPRKSSSQVRGRQEDPAISCHSPTDKSSGDLKQWEIMEMLKVPNNQPQLLSGQRPKDFSRKDDQEHVYRAGKQTKWERSCRRDCDGSHGTLCWKNVPTLQSPNDLSTEDQIFLERFSATSNNLKSCELSKNECSAYSKIGVKSLGQPYSSSRDHNSRVRLLSAPGRLNCGRTGSLSFDRSFQPPTLPSDVQLINSLPPCVPTRPSLGEAGRPHSSREDKSERYDTFEPTLLPDYAASFDCPSPSSSVNRSLDNSERQFSWACPCTDCLNKYEHQDTFVQCAHGMHDWKRSAAARCFPSLMTHSSSFPAQCQSLLLNPRQNCCLSNTSQPSTQCRCDACNISCRFLPPALLSCHHPRCSNAVQRHKQCHFPGRSHPVPDSSDQHCKFQNTSTPSLYGQNVHCSKKDTLPPYIPPQVIQPNGTCRPMSHGNSQETLLSHEPHQFANKDTVIQDEQVDAQPKGSRMKETDREPGLVWLSPEEMNLIQQLRLSSEKAMAICRHDAAACIQRYWRKYLERKTEDLKELGQEDIVRRLYRTMQTAARIIQRAWRSVLRSRKEKMLARRAFPEDLKNFYEIIKSRQATRGRLAPSFELFAKSVERIQAATEGARVRRRLKSHRLQTIIMEIKEIRMLLCEMSQEENCTSTPFLFSQLCTQLRQKILQLHAALNGKQMEARFLLRRCPATPLTLHPSRSISPKPIYLVPNQKSVDQALAKLSSGTVGARKFYSPPLTNPASVDIQIAHSDPSKIQSAVLAEHKLVHTQSFVPLIQGSKGNTVQLWNSSPDPADSADTPNSAKLLQWYFVAQRTPPKRIAGQGTPTDFSSGHEADVKKGVIEILDPSQKKCDLSFSSQKASPKSKDPEYSLNKSFDEQPLPAPQRSKIPVSSFEEMVVGGTNASLYMTEYAPSTDAIDKPKRPFLKRKSRVMPPQKLDWSKVKPMVSSRLEPELKTKLSLCKGSAKEPTKNNSKKANYSNVKSRLFSYEENVSPSNSADGACVHLRSVASSEAGYPPMLKGGCRESRGSSLQGTENGRNSGVLANRQRAASPDLMHLRRMTGADRRCSQTSMLETRSVAAYSSQFDSARYRHKLGNSEETSKGTAIDSCQQRTQRIRLRIVPRSKENDVGDLFVQEEMQELWEDPSLSARDIGKRHSNRYAIYQEQDARYSSRVAETTRPDCAEEGTNITGRASRKKTQQALRHEVYKYFETK